MVKKILILIIIVLNQLLISTVILNPVNFPERSIAPPFPLIQQPDNITCGPTSTTMLLNYYGIDVSVSEVEAKTKTHWFNYKETKIGMTLPALIKHALQDYHIPAKVEYGTIRKLKYYVSRGYYPIILVRSGQKTWHYIVAIGYNRDSIIIADPGNGEKYPVFERVFNDSWSFSGNLGGEHYSDFYGNLLKKAGVSDHTFIVPKNRLTN